MSNSTDSFVESSPLDVFQDLREAYFRYYDTPFRLASDQLNSERRLLLDRAGGAWQEPLIELRPRYKSTGRSPEQTIGELGGSEFADFASRGLVQGIPALYKHQEQALLATQMGKDVLITAGTGSGKTETFLLSIMSALLADSKTWTGPPADPNSWWGSRRGDYVPQRNGEGAGRKAAMRSLILYPMNALVEDQLVRLRKTFDSPEVRQWLNDNRGGHRFYFGRYTGATPVLGSEQNGLAVNELRRHLQRAEQLHAQAKDYPNPDARFYVSDPNGAEMRSRWDMAHAPPDILITNYSMLNIMLMRPRNQHIFEGTREWLKEDPHRQFTMVVDELHTYRGTAGTEISYLLRNLRDRIGLTDQPERFRIVAASASLDDERDGAFVSQFFAKASDFTYVTGDLVTPTPTAPDLTAHADAFANATDVSPSEAKDLLERTHTDSILPSAFLSEEGDFESVQVSTLEARLFGDSHRSTEATKGLLSCLAKRPSSPDSPKLRAHYLFRNVPGMWACCDPECQAVEETDGERTVGKLYIEPATRCACGARVLELLYCQDCGEVYLGGFTPSPPWESSDRPTSLLADLSEIERLPDQASTTRSCENYVVYWPRDSSLEADSRKWGNRTLSFMWRPVTLQPQAGELYGAAEGSDSQTGWQFLTFPSKPILTRGKADAYPGFPTRCPRCESDWETRFVSRNGISSPLKVADPERYRSPLRGMRTGFEKINQVLISELIERLDPKNRSLVMFSDSRQDAAKLASGVALRHYQDLVRLLFTRELEDAELPDYFDLALAGLTGESTEPAAKEAAGRLSTDDRFKSLTILAMQLSLNMPGAQDKLDKELESLRGPTEIARLEVPIRDQLLRLGVNPGGTQPSQQEQWYKEHNTWKSISWTRLVDWTTTQPRFKLSLDQHEERLHGKISFKFRDTLYSALNSGAGRDVESLGIAWLTLRSDTAPLQVDPTSSQALMRASLRLLTSKMRIEGFRNGTIKPTKQLQELWAKIAESQGRDVAEVEKSCELAFADNWVEYLVQRDALAARSSDLVWVCPRCSRRHLHPGVQLCLKCYAKLPDGPIANDESIRNDDYYAWRAGESRGYFRLSAAELTGQTDRAEAQDRQLRFQDIFLGGAPHDERERADGLDLLSVTTTMEAGVDIGGLNAVVLANMPPSRFNYQQRVGRAGRRETAVAHALTMCRGRSHDDYYFANPLQITNEPTPAPYLTMGQESILLRVLRSELLRRAFAAQRWDEDDELEEMNPHGPFGRCVDWPARSSRIQAWFHDNPETVERTIDAFMIGVSPSLRPAPDWATTTLIAEVNEAAVATIGPSVLGERLANTGLLPMFGFPTRVRYLHLQRPTRSYPWPPRGVIDRESSIAVSQFAPGSEQVRDGNVYTAGGVVGFSPTSGSNPPKPSDEPLGPRRLLLVCRRCSYLKPSVGDPPPGCPQCAAGPDFFSELDLRQPEGYFQTEKHDFDGSFSWSARAGVARAVADKQDFVRATDKGVEALSGPGERFIINDRHGKLYGFRAAQQGSSWPGMLSSDPELAPGIDANDMTGDEIRVALGAVQHTDLLFLGTEAPPSPGSGIRLDFNNRRQPSGLDELWQGRRAAWFSLAFLLREAAAIQLDVQPLEFSAGIHVSESTEDASQTVMAFLADNLENGAGFATRLGSKPVFPEFMARIDRIVAQWRQRPHAQGCRGSCYDCLRDYNNMAYHPLLDWRLASDLLAVCRTGALPTEAFENSTEILDAWGKGMGGVLRSEPETGFLIIERNGQEIAVIAKHPLEAYDEEEASDRVLNAQLAAEEAGANTFVAVDTYSLDRQPRAVLELVEESVSESVQW